MKTSKRTPRRRFRRGIVSALVAGLLLLAVLWLMVQHKPGWYRPVVLDEPGLRRARSEATTLVDDISDRIVGGDPFEVAVSDRAVNEWLAGLGGLWPDARDAIPPELSDLAARFDGGEVRLGALCEGRRVRVILSAAFSARISSDGRNVEVALVGVHGGSLPMPRAALEKLLDPLVSEIPGQGSGKTSSPLESALRDVRSLDDLLDGVKVPNRFVWPNGERPFRIDSITIDNGELNLRIEPL